MADRSEETLLSKIAEKIHHVDDSSSDSDDDKSKSSSSSLKSKIYRLFGRERPVHQILGGGKSADLLLWRNKKASASLLGGITAIWVLFELMEYNLLSLVSHILILSLAILFLWFNATTFINKSPPRIPQVSVPEDVAVNIALHLRFEVNRSIAALREIALGRDLKKFVAILIGLWIISILGSCCSFISFFYIVFLLLNAVPFVYEKYEDKIDSFGEKATAEIKKQYAVFDAKVLSKLLKSKKH